MKKKSDEIGMNRTGNASSPVDSKKMLENVDPNVSTAPRIEKSRISAVRTAYSENAAPVGSVPPPASVKGTITTGTQMLMGKNPAVFINKLGERLAFERTGTRLYQAVISRYDVLKATPGFPKLGDLKKIHEDELAHFQMLWDSLVELGADPTVVTPGADLAGVESTGLLQVITDPRTRGAECLHSLLVAELADHDGWEMLIDLARSLGHDTLAGRFEKALQQEEMHLSSVRNWMTTIINNEAAA